MKPCVAVSIGIGAGLITGAIIGGASYALYKSMRTVLKHETYTVSLLSGEVPTGRKATVFYYPELKMSVIKVSRCKFPVFAGDNGMGSVITTEPFPAILVDDSAVDRTFKIPTSVFNGELSAGEYVVAKVVRDGTGLGRMTFAIATNAESEKQGAPLHPGTWEITLPIIITWEAK